MLQYAPKHVQGDQFKSLDQSGHKFLRGHIDPKAGKIIKMQEPAGRDQSVKKNRGIHINSNKCRRCGKCVDGIMHLVSVCKMLAGNYYLKKPDKDLKVHMTTQAAEKELLEKGKSWYKLKWE